MYIKILEVQTPFFSFQENCSLKKENRKHEKKRERKVFTRQNNVLYQKFDIRTLMDLVLVVCPRTIFRSEDLEWSLNNLVIETPPRTLDL